MSEGNSRSGDAPNGAEPKPDVPPYDAPTEVFGAIGDKAAGTEHVSDAEQIPETESEQASEAAEPESDDAESAVADPAVDDVETTETDAAAAGDAKPDAVPAPSQPPAADESPTIAQPVVPAAADVPTETVVPAQTVVSPQAESPVQPPVIPPEDGAPQAADGSGFVPPWRKIAIGTGAVVAVLTLLYAADWITSSDRVPRGVTVAGIEVGGKSHSDAEELLRSELGARAEQPVSVDVGDRQVEVLPAAAGLGVDWNATLDRAGSQPINPITRLTSFFGSREIGVVSTTDEQALTAAIDGLRVETDRDPVEGDVVFDGSTPIAVAPLAGRILDADGTRRNLQTEWASGATEAVYESTPVTVTQEAVDQALENIAAPAVEAPVIVAGRENVDATLPTDRVGEVLRFDPDGQGGLTPIYDTDVATGILAPQLVRTEVPPRDASFTFSGGAPTVVPGEMGELVEWRKTLEQLPALLSADGPRTTEAIYEPAPPALTTEAAQNLGVREVIAEYTTGGFEYASGVNIGLTAQIVNGALVKPKETFSLNQYTGPRGTAQGFVESGIIDNGRPDRAVGGGISQFATTLYNASYFAGMEDTDHTEHSYYISRYPEAREATVFEGAIDLQFTNPNDTGVVIQSFADSSSVTVRLWGTKTVDVESITGSRTNFTSPDTVTLPAGAGCVASGGGQGFTASDTRVISDAASGREISRNTRTVKYDPIPIVRCVQPDRPAPAADPAPEPDEDE
ncbi:VanW family protein [Rhodococcus sp. IEGM 1401]|uniref:VanW family protein n=1 Tax=unclassified Rhodococcus (in: high G+C Gram-positive bacteria) TaxID=192944 RepID=UPI0022B52842|nr:MULTISPECIES: VanW family protein [unclassified Rhodococcus (in: high G+C Gram-positive bacteria)]MCZ4560818.1 VanW family protein [Rhodococcus sp. IEGM 1401]MDI9920958.1 VanW family protein [Rhodococcus sp. IEGM 1372]MDV8033441.1 VanW family protein [Rhodococcus sp. IEGM 1414]